MSRCARKGCAVSGARRWLGRLRGVRLDGEWFCSAACVAAVTAERLAALPRSARPSLSVPPLRVGVLLRHQGAITAGQLQQALADQVTSGRRLGAELLHLGLVTPEQLLKALAAQAGVRYLTAVDTDTVRSAPGDLSIDEVRALGLVPLREQGERRLTVACRAPVPRAAFGALQQLTGWTADPYLVSDGDFERLLDAYGRNRQAAAVRIDVIELPTHAHAAARVGAEAAAQGSISIAEAVCGAMTWLRVTGPGGINTFLVPQDTTWQAATTSR